jgi:hypothetical protein
VTNIKVAELAINSPNGPISIGNFRSTLDKELNIYYNIDLGYHKEAIYDTNQRNYKNLRKIHFSLHDSGQGHLKPKKGVEKLQKGNLSDGSKLLSAEEDLTIVGLESFYLDRAPSPCLSGLHLKVLSPPNVFSSYSILWIFVHSSYPEILPNRILWVNLWGHEQNFYRVQTASLSDILITPKTQTVLSIEGWSIRACYLKTLLPIFNMCDKDITLIHPKGQELPWRAFTFVDAHLPLSSIIKTQALKKPIILTTHKPAASEASAHPSAWVKYSI